MTKIKRTVEESDLISPEIYAKNRKQFRNELVQFKKNRRIPIGPYATFYFESFETMLAQIQEMLHIEKGGEEQLIDELNAYNPLIPKGNELVATLMFEIDNPEKRADFLGKAGGIENNVFIEIEDYKIKGIPEKDLDRTSDEGKASSVQFVHFNFSNEFKEKFKNLDKKIIIGIEHNSYNHMSTISKDVQTALSKDFD